MNNLASTIVAVSTPPGKGGVALIRISGTEAKKIAERVFIPRSKKTLSEYPDRYAVYGDIVSMGDVIDDGIATVFSAPHSYTGEDTVEVTCHGGVLVTKSVLEAFLSAGAQMATAGEFTRRAVINGNLRLSEAEAIATLLEAESDAQMRLSSTSSRAQLSSATDAIRAEMLSVMASLYAAIDYPDEDLATLSRDEMLTLLMKIDEKLLRLAATYKTGHAITDGVKTAIIGKPNVGKSSLYNALSGEDLAIVTDISGTTRDVLSAKVAVGRVMLSLSDTAGLRDTDDTVERLGVERSRKTLSDAELVLAVFDGASPLDEEDHAVLSLLESSTAVKVAILNKADKEQNPATERTIKNAFTECVSLSAKDGNTDSLAEILDRLFTDGELKVGQDAILSSARQHAALVRSEEFLRNAISALRSGFPEDAVSGDLSLAIGAIGELDGREVSEELVSEIFSHFCVGK